MMKWPGYIASIDPKRNKATIVYELFGDGYLYEIFVDLDKVPEDVRHLGQYCRISGDKMEWCRDVWTQEDIDRAREKGRELDELFEEKKDD